MQQQAYAEHDHGLQGPYGRSYEAELAQDHFGNADSPQRPARAPCGEAEAAVSARCSARGAGDGIEPSSALSLRSSFLLICGSFHSDFLRAFSAECSRDCTVRSGSSRTSAISRSFSSWT